MPRPVHSSERLRQPRRAEARQNVRRLCFPGSWFPVLALTLRRMPLLLAVVLALAACAQRPATVAPTTPASPIPAAVSPTSAPAPTSAPPAAAPSAPVPGPTSAPPATATSAPTSAPTVAPSQTPAPALAEEILFLRGGDLVALAVDTGGERVLATEVRDFAATSDGRLLALVRGADLAAELWALRRATGELWQLTSNDRVESGPSWAPDGQSLVYTAAPTVPTAPPTWESWSRWCSEAEVRILDLGPAAAPALERPLGAGCDPAFGPDGRRIVFAAAPTGSPEALSFPGAQNTIRMVNRQGENGWDVAQADGSTPEQGQLVYGPAWAPDGGQIAYQRFLGYQALVDINLTEVGSSFQRNGAPVGLGAGWMLPPLYAPDGRRLAVVEHNFSDARGFEGYDIWRLTVLQLGEMEEVVLPSATLQLGAVEVARLPRATTAAWAPDGAALVVLLPTGWRPGLSDQEPLFPAPGPGELWLWRPGGDPEARLAGSVDSGSPVLWLPAAP